MVFCSTEQAAHDNMISTQTAEKRYCVRESTLTVDFRYKRKKQIFNIIINQNI
jgi:hypothetical protein